MRRLSLIMVLSLILASFTPMTLMATDAVNTYELSELDLSVGIPNKYSVITRETDAGDPVFGKYGVSKESVTTHFETNNIYLNALSDNSEEIVVTMLPNTISDFNTISDPALEILASKLEEQFQADNVNILDYEIYQHTQTKFLKIHFYDSINTAYGLQYYTIYNYKAMNFTLKSYSGDITSEQENAIKTVVDSVKYNTVCENSEQEETSSFVYTDEESGVTFSVPANWIQEELHENREFLDVSFASAKEAGCSIFYGSTDVWEKMPETEKVGHVRSDINNTILTKTDIADMYGVSEDTVMAVTYNGIEYYQCEITQTQDMYDMTFSITMTSAIYIDNGWMYTFQFSGTSGSKLFGDFVDMLNSVQYPSTLDDPIMASDNSLADVYSLAYKIGRIVAMLVVALPIIIVIIVIVIVRKKKAKKAESDSATSLQQAITYDQTMQNANIGETAILNEDMMQQQMYVRPHLIRIRNNERIELSKAIFGIGKDANYADYCIMDNSAISRMHANIISRCGEYFVVDNNSTNHTYVNGMMIPSNVEVQITNGARIHFADEEFEFRVE